MSTENHLPPSCRGCEKRDACCADGSAPGPGEVSGGSLVGQAAAFFLLPIAVAIAAAAVAGTERSILAGSIGLFGTLIAAAVVSRAIRRKRTRVNP